MGVRRTISSSYLSMSLAIASGLVANLAPPAQAQVNPNIQTQLNISSPPITAVLPSTTTPTEPDLFFVRKTVGQSGCASIKDNGVQRVVNDAVREKGLTIKDLTKDQIRDIIQQYIRDQEAFRLSAREKALAIQVPIHTNCTYAQASQFKVTLPFNPTYETNILKAGNNSSPGESAGFGGNVLMTGGVAGHPFDVVALSVGETSTRYAPNFSPSSDSTSTQLFYQMFLHADGYNPDSNGNKTYVPNIVPGSPATPPPTGLTTFDTLSFGYQNQMAFTPTFHAEKADFFTPQATLSRLNIGLDDPSAKPCKDASTPVNQQFCYYANLSLTAGQSYSDVRSLQNANFAVSGTIGWRPDMTNWNLSLQAMATEKEYEDVLGGRRDLLLQIGSNFAYSTKVTIAKQDASLSFSLPITYYKNYSTLSTAAWSGLIIMPTLSLAFTYPPS
jgi:hypothetical protein